MATVIQDLIGATSAPQASPLAPNSSAEIQDRFLTLLVTQLKNQDPLSPMDNSQITTQLSQISTVNGINKLNDTVSALATALAASQTLTSASLIGRDVIAPSINLTLADKRAAGAVELSAPADRVALSILGPAGDIVKHLELGPAEAGLKPFTWDGVADDGRAAKDGTYTFAVEATLNGTAVAATTFTVGTVTGVGVSGAAPSIIINGSTEVGFADVKRIQ